MGGLRIGKWFGLEIRIDYSWIIIFTLVLWTFTAGVFPTRVPGLNGATYLAMGFSGTLLFFLSVLLHEISHSLVAESKGIPVDGITLFVFGGIAHTRTEFEEPGDEFLIAAAGPVASFAIAGLFGLLSWAGPRIGAAPAVTAVAAYLALLNLILAVFNLLPGFPLDGGRLFRAAIWKATGDLTRATRVASIGGRVLAYALMGLGLLQIFAGGLIGGIWMIFIGWFVRNAAESSYLQQVLRSSLADVTVEDVMTTDIQTVPADLTLLEFVDAYVFRGRYESYPVVDEERPAGVLTFRQVKGIPQEEWSRRTVADTMTPLEPDGIVAPSTRMIEAMEKIQGSKAGRLLVEEEGRLVGIVTAGDLSRWIRRAQLLGSRS
ncbi:MAG: CBS domain-containing protein [Gemmatimonas sp.]|nr:CBS domain-containing protein [Gemmatimonas sp.]